MVVSTHWATDSNDCTSTLFIFSVSMCMSTFVLTCIGIHITYEGVQRVGQALGEKHSVDESGSISKPPIIISNQAGNPNWFSIQSYWPFLNTSTREPTCLCWFALIWHRVGCPGQIHGWNKDSPKTLITAPRTRSKSLLTKRKSLLTAHIQWLVVF